MNTDIARAIAKRELAQYLDHTWNELRALLPNQPLTSEIVGSDSKEYQIEVSLFWDSLPEQDIRISCSVDDGGIRAYFPITESSLKSKTAEQGAAANP